MTAAALLIFFAVFPLGSIVAHLRQDTIDGEDLRRLTEPLPAPRQRLAYPEPVTPMGLPARDATFTYHGSSRVRTVAPIVAEVADTGRHHIGVAPGTPAQQAKWNTPTGQFWAIVEFNAALDEPCSHCSTPEDGERAHVGCPGCACPCGNADRDPLPAGVQGYAIAGWTR